MAKAKKIALENICRAQRKQKEYCYHCSGKFNYEVGKRVMVYMPGDVSGKNCRLERPYHRPYHILSITPTNAKVQLIKDPESSLFVAISRLRLLPKLADTNWTGTRKHKPRGTVQWSASPTKRTCYTCNGTS